MSRRVTSVVLMSLILLMTGLSVYARPILDNGTVITRFHSTLYGRTYVEHSGYLDKGVEYGMGKGIMDAPDPDAYYNGLLMVNVIPYKKDTGTDTSSPAISTKDDTDDRNSTGAWFDLQGRKLAGTPMQKGV